MELNGFTEILGTLFYGCDEEIVQTWNELGDGNREEFLKVCKREGTMPFVYRKLYDAGLREGLEELGAQNVRQNAFAIGNQMKLESLYAFLDGHGVRYAPIKGIDLAFRIYPSPALRTFCDWDILFHDEDFFNAVQLLLDNGWTTNGTILNNSLPEHFHSSILHKDGISLEPHWMLPGFDGATPKHVWRFIHPVKEGGCRHLLEPALNMLLLTRHASRGFYTVMPLSRMLLDAAFIMQSDGFDWKRCREVSDELGLPCSADLIASFHEFFPKSLRDQMQADNERSDAYRKLFEQRDKMAPRSNRDNLVFNSSNHFSLGWIWTKIKAKCSSRHIRRVHHLPPNGQHLKVIAYMISTFFCNAMHGIGFLLRRDSSVQNYADLLKKAEGTYGIK